MPREQDVRPAHAALAGQLEDALRARVERLVHGMAEAGQALARVPHRPGGVRGDRGGVAARRDLRLGLHEEAGAGLGRAQDHGAAAEDARRDGALERAGVGGERHPRGDVRGHHPVLGDRDEQQVEEVALVRGGLLAAQEQVEVLREGQPPHQVAAEVAAAHLDPVRIGLADVADRAGIGVHAAATLRAAPAAVKTAISWPR